jgi:Tfp pilus assembly protein PilN
MTTPTEHPTIVALLPPESAIADRALRVPAIAANLLPMEIVESRRERQVRRVVLAALAAFVAVLAAWYGLVSYQTTQARGAVAAAEDNGQALLRQQRDFAEVVRVQTDSQAITGQLADLLSTDLRWSRLLTAVAQVAPPGVALTGVSGALAPPAAAGGAAAVQLPNMTGEQTVGTLTINGIAPDPFAVAAYLDALGKIKGLGNPLLDGATVQDGKLQFSVRLDITSGALGGRFPAATGGN